MKIISIDRYFDLRFNVYDEFNNLYEERNAEDGKYSIRELYEYSLEDQASKKRKFLMTLMEELDSKGYLKVSNAISLYDNLLVGRKRSAPSKNSKAEMDDSLIVESSEFEEAEFEENELYEEIASLLNFNLN